MLGLRKTCEIELLASSRASVLKYSSLASVNSAYVFCRSNSADNIEGKKAKKHFVFIMLPATAKLCLSLCFRLQATTAYFRPTEIPSCPNAPCLTLSFLKFNTLPVDRANGDLKF